MLKEMPKVELHVHLDGSVLPSTASEYLNVDIKEIERDMKVPSNCKDLNEYLKRFEIPAMVMQEKNRLERIAYELTVDMKNENVIYAEVRFAPLKHLNNGLNPYQVVEAVYMGLNRLGLKTNLILCMMRGDIIEDNKLVIDVAKHYLNKGVCAVDLAGAEAIYKTSDYEELFAYAKKLGVPFTIHAGEADGYDSIKAAIDFGATRLGHGVRIIEHEDLIKEVIEKDIHFEVCPTSNVQTKVCDKFKNHPIKKMYDLGISLSVNTDNRTVSNTTLTHEYTLLRDNFNFTYDDFVKMNIEAIKHSFLSDSEKEKLINKYNSLR